MYESVFIFSGQITPKAAKSKFENLTDKIKESGGKILKTETWGLRSLAYKIKKNSKGYYFLINSECKIEVLSKFNTLVKQDDEFLRFLNLKIDSVDKDLSPLDETNADGAVNEK